eukprot:358115_1
MSKKGRLKIDHLSLKGGEQSKRRNDKHSVINITAQFMDDYNVIKQTILQQNHEECMLLDQFIAAKCFRLNYLNKWVQRSNAIEIPLIYHQDRAKPRL